MDKIQRKKIMKSQRRRKKSTIKNPPTFEGKFAEVNKIQGNKTIKSKRRRNELMIKKDRLLEVCSESMETVMQENYGMLLEILSWLPVKDLLRFMSVSKQWKTLISSHPFRKLHREKHTSSPPLLIATYDTCESHIPYENYLITFDFFNETLVEKVTVQLRSNRFYMSTPPYQSKLLLFRSLQLKKFYLCNPSTRQYFLLTNPSRFSSPDFKKIWRSEYGYIPSKDEYIMVHLIKLSNGNIYCEVLNNIFISDDNFKLHYNNQWRSSTEATLMFQNVIWPVVFLGGVFYWQAVTNPQNPKEDGFILSFDVETDSFSTIYYPPDVSIFDARLMDLNNELYLCVYPERTVILEMWKWSSDAKLWSRYWRFDFVKLFGFTRGVCHHLRSFRFELFIYYLKYVKGYEEQPSDDEVSAEMGEFRLVDGSQEIPIWTELAVHTNLFTL